MCGSCTPEDDLTLCNRHGASCGLLANAVLDNCGMTRTPDCGLCLTEDGGNGCGASGNSFDNVCGCQMPLSGCLVKDQCCAGSTCGVNGLCCVPPANKCNDDSDCCSGHCTAKPDAGAVCEVNASTP